MRIGVAVPGLIGKSLVLVKLLVIPLLPTNRNDLSADVTQYVENLFFVVLPKQLY